MLGLVKDGEDQCDWSRKGEGEVGTNEVRQVARSCKALKGTVRALVLTLKAIGEF